MNLFISHHYKYMYSLSQKGGIRQVDQVSEGFNGYIESLRLVDIHTNNNIYIE